MVRNCTRVSAPHRIILICPFIVLIFKHRTKKKKNENPKEIPNKLFLFEL